jgi:thymidine kinase
MFSGKSQELMRLIERAVIADLRVQVFYPRVALRQSVRDIKTRLEFCRGHVNFTEMCENAFEHAERFHTEPAEIIAVDETQFFSYGIVELVRYWRHQGKTIYVAGLDMDYQENPFGAMGDLMCLADEVVKLHAVCTRCKKEPAMISYRLSRDAAQIVVGESNYTALCLECYDHMIASTAPQGGESYTSVGTSAGTD